MNTKRENIMKMSKVLDALMKAGAIFLIVTIAVHTVWIVLAPSLDLTQFTVSDSDIFGRARLVSGPDEFRVIMLDRIISVLVMPVILFMAGFIFKDMRRGNSPFTSKNANRLRIIALLLVALGIVIPPLKMLLTMIFIPSVTAYFSIHFGEVIFAAVFFCLALIFEYGAELQRESDETL